MAINHDALATGIEECVSEYLQSRDEGFESCEDRFDGDLCV